MAKLDLKSMHTSPPAATALELALLKRSSLRRAPADASGVNPSPNPNPNLNPNPNPNKADASGGPWTSRRASAYQWDAPMEP
eukprot:scaffold74365_cov60-Phaeocystis_antarctica.AAC.1